MNNDQPIKTYSADLWFEHDTRSRRGLSTEGCPCVDQKVCNPLPVSLFQIQEDMGRAAQQVQYQNELGVPHLSPKSVILLEIFRGIPNNLCQESHQKEQCNSPKLGFCASEIQPLVPVLLICKDHTTAADFNGALARLTVLVVGVISILHLCIVFFYVGKRSLLRKFLYIIR